MSKFRKALLIVLLTSGYSFSLKAQEITDAVSYLDYVGSQFQEVSKDIMSYISAASHGKSAKKVEKRRLELIETLKTAEKNTRNLKSFKGDHAFRDTVASYFQISRIVLTSDYGKIVDLEEISEQSYDMMEAYLTAKERANKKADEAFVKVLNQEKIFAEKNNIKIVDSNSILSQKMEQAAKVNDYYNSIYLIFFKSTKDEAYLLDALSKEEVSSLEQFKGNLEKNAVEGMKKMMRIGPFNGDASMKQACSKALDFYKYESAKMTEIVNFILKRENFEKTKKAFEAKRAEDRTQEDVNTFNKLVNDYNAAVGKSNALNNELNKTRADVINFWQKSAERFLDKHTPKYR